jgi:hypothetical protein
MLGPIQFLCGSFFNLGNVLDPSAGNPENQTTYRSTVDSYPDPPNWKNYAWEHAIDNVALKNVFLPTIGDPEFFASICALDNPMPIRRIDLNAKGGELGVSYIVPGKLKAGSAVGTHRGTVEQGVSATNLMPWCVVNSTGDQDRYRTLDDKPLPKCQDVGDDDLMSFNDLRSWSFRGAINGGLMVFLYLDELAKGLAPVPPYDHCEQLP